MFKGLMLAAAGAATVAALFVAGTASAQYPEPKGSLVCTTRVSVTIENTEVHATLRDSKGNPVSGVGVSFSITAGSGKLDSNTAYTDSNGDAWVKAQGSNLGVQAVYDGLQCSAVAQVLGSTFSPPSTGDAGLAAPGTEGASRNDAVLAGALAVMGASGLGAVALRRRRLNRQA
jgi:hypothetical protein